MKEIYLDCAATTQPLPVVIEKMTQVMREDYGNPSSYHQKGLQAESHIKAASAYFATILQGSPDEIIYTSGGTESNNMAIIGTALAYQRRGKRIITTQIEHPSVKEVFKYLETQGFEVIYLPVDGQGYVNREELVEAVNDDTTLVSIMHVNNEIGTIQPIEAIASQIKEKNPHVHFHVDGIQSFGKIPINRQGSAIDLFSISGHKIYGPKGVGILYKNKNTRIHPLILGGGQQKGYRSGTENVPGIVGIHEAAKQVMSHMEEYAKQAYALKQELAAKVISRIEGAYVNGPDLMAASPYILNIGFKNIKSEVLLHALEAEKIYVSSGSACSSNKKQEAISTLKAIGQDHVDEAIRFSFGIHNTCEDIEKTVLVLEKNIPILRKVLGLGGHKR